mmetsp:Transcript_147403/g.259909  ORF Transcript_147403/g.259909 Transcript_147403/m.259909 type:complete len:86 (+) Transcript_147403:671-928(+)
MLEPLTTPQLLKRSQPLKTRHAALQEVHTPIRWLSSGAHRRNNGSAGEATAAWGVVAPAREMAVKQIMVCPVRSDVGMCFEAVPP